MNQSYFRRLATLAVAILMMTSISLSASAQGVNNRSAAEQELRDGLKKDVQEFSSKYASQTARNGARYFIDLLDILNKAYQLNELDTEAGKAICSFSSSAIEAANEAMDEAHQRWTEAALRDPKQARQLWINSIKATNDWLLLIEAKQHCKM